MKQQAALKSTAPAAGIAAQVHVNNASNKQAAHMKCPKPVQHTVLDRLQSRHWLTGAVGAACTALACCRWQQNMQLHTAPRRDGHSAKQRPDFTRKWHT
jgi:hypothetical protein